jgi:hypothetical protein
MTSHERVESERKPRPMLDGNISRRGFLRGAGVLGAASLAGPQSLLYEAFQTQH